MTDTGPDICDYCAQCGDLIDDEEWHPVETEVDENGDVAWYTFCDGKCQTAWTADE